MRETTCAYCGTDVDELEGLEQDGLVFCSEECADEYEEEEPDDDGDEDEDDFDDEDEDEEDEEGYAEE